MVLGPRFQQAVGEALRLHAAQKWKGTEIPYPAHLLSTAALVLQFGGDEDLAIAGLLHDAVEDAGGRPTLDRLREVFGDKVAEIVEGCTDSFEALKPPWRARKEAYIAAVPTKPIATLLVSACDKLDNARAIVADPTILVCDEPTGDLDRDTAEEILRLLQLLNREQGKTTTMVTHDPKAAVFARRIVRLDKGALVAEAAGAAA